MGSPGCYDCDARDGFVDYGARGDCDGRDDLSDCGDHGGCDGRDDGGGDDDGQTPAACPCRDPLDGPALSSWTWQTPLLSLLLWR